MEDARPKSVSKRRVVGMFPRRSVEVVSLNRTHYLTV